TDRAYSLNDLTQTPDPTVLEYENIGTARTVNSTEQWIDDDGIDKSDIIKFYFFSNDKEKLENWFKFLNAHFTNEGGFQVYRTSNHNSEIMVYGTDKGTGLITLLDDIGISIDDVHAFGDSMNDIPMFKIAGKSTAMQNGQEDVKQIADDMTEVSCDEDRLQNYLEKHYLLSSSFIACGFFNRRVPDMPFPYYHRGYFMCTVSAFGCCIRTFVCKCFFQCIRLP